MYIKNRPNSKTYMYGLYILNIWCKYKLFMQMNRVHAVMFAPVSFLFCLLLNAAQNIWQSVTCRGINTCLKLLNISKKCPYVHVSMNVCVCFAHCEWSHICMTKQRRTGILHSSGKIIQLYCDLDNCMFVRLTLLSGASTFSVFSSRPHPTMWCHSRCIGFDSGGKTPAVRSFVGM